MEPVGAPADERVARRRSRSGPGASGRGIVWVLLLGGILALQHFEVGWQVGDGRLRAGLHLLAWVAGLAFGWSGLLREPDSWVTWPPEGALYERSLRRRWADLAEEWWEHLWAAPALLLFATMVSAVGLLAWVRPRELAGTLHPGDLLWHVVIALALGDTLNREMLVPRAEAATARGMHLSPVSFVRWRRISHAVVDRAAGTIRLFTRERPWLPLRVMGFESPGELEGAAGLVGQFVPLLAPAEEPFGSRLRWRLFIGAWIAVVAALGVAGLALLLLPGEVVGIHWLATIFEQMPEATLALVLACGVLLSGELARLRGVRVKRIVSEES